MTFALIILTICYFMAGALVAFLTKLSLEDGQGGVWHNVKIAGAVALVFLLWPLLFVLLAVMAVIDR